jgi:uncharacterized membrane protein YhhN
VTGASWIFLVVTAAFALADWFAVARDAKRVEYVCKPATLVALIGVAVTLDPLHTDTRAWFVAALVLSLIGDIFLMVPRNHRTVAAGLSAFLVGHVAYIVGFNLHGGSGGAIALAAVPVVLVVIGFASRILPDVLAGDDRSLVGPLLAYLVVISAMVASALATGNPWAGAGAALFFASDLIIAWNEFRHRLTCGPLAIIVTYHVAQVLLVLSLLH